MMNWLNYEVKGQGDNQTKYGKKIYIWGRFVTTEHEVMTVWIDVNVLRLIVQADHRQHGSADLL